MTRPKIILLLVFSLVLIFQPIDDIQYFIPKSVFGEDAQFTLTTSVNPPGGGSVTPSSSTYPAGSVVTLTANPNTGYEFDHWNGDLSGWSNPTTITMDSDKNVTAHFTKIRCGLITDVFPHGSGSVSLNPPGGIYDYGTAVELTATANPDYEFAYWDGDFSGTSNPVTIIMDYDKKVIAFFRISHMVTITEGPSANPTRIDSGETTELRVDAEDSISGHSIDYSWTVNPHEGYFIPHSFAQNPTWYAPENDTGSDKTYTFTVTASCRDYSEIKDTGTVQVTVKSEDLFLQDIVIKTTKVYEAKNSITAGPSVIIEPPGDVTFRAGNVIYLKPGFEARNGSNFHALIDPELRK